VTANKLKPPKLRAIHQRIAYLTRRICALAYSTLSKRFVRIYSGIVGRHVVRGNYYPEQQRTLVLDQAVFHLENLDLTFLPTRIEIVSFPFGVGSASEPGIACFALQNGRGYNYSKHFLKDISAALNTQAVKPILVIDDPAYVIPYMTNHFGHFLGDCLGSIIALSHRIPADNRKLYVIYPTSLDESISHHANFQNITKLDAKILNNNNILFTNAKVLPQLSPWQNLCLAQQIYRNLPSGDCKKPKKVFLTSERASRIANISEVARHLRSAGFFILNPTEHKFEDTLSIIRDCTTLLTENGSITLNVLIARSTPYLVLTSAKGLVLNESEFAGGGIFNSFNSFWAQYLVCTTPADAQSYHAYSTQIFVDLNELDSAINKLEATTFG
jgi:hypothetical protein